MPILDYQSLAPPIPLILRGVDWFINRRAARRLKLEVRVSNPSHWSEIKVRNSGKRSIIVHATDWCIGRRRNRRSFNSVTWDREILPDNTLEITFLPYGVFRKNVWRFSGGKDFHTLRFRAHTSSGMMRFFHPPPSCIFRIMQIMVDKIICYEFFCLRPGEPVFRTMGIFSGPVVTQHFPLICKGEQTQGSCQELLLSSHDL